ncbi:Metallo-dependent phosphatase [Ceratobasidium sp. AG-I]|nr:Metallo-dependent phosphatase [Ceratobasidium sp. AG-I]
MRQPLQQLLKKVDFNATHDTLVHAGDIITKGPHSRQVLQKLILVKALGVRGNQDQKVVEWRGWIEWVAGRNGGKEWLHKMEKRAEATKKLTKTDYKHFRQEAAAKGWKIPVGWEFGSRVYRLARHLKKEEYQYLLDLPTALHIPSLHTVVVHAGILPMDPRRRILSPKQPLSHPPKVKHNKTEPVLRNLQELALLSDIPQNKDPWVKLNMRSVLNDGSISRYKDGAPWTELWHKVIKLCDGFDSNLQLATDNITSELAPKQNWKEWIDEDFKGIQSLPCKDVTVVYGHAASRGLDIKRWSKGLDTGCVYNLRLTALVIGKRWRTDSETNATHFVDTEDVLETDDEVEGEIISFGRKGKGKIVQVPCAGGKPRR